MKKKRLIVAAGIIFLIILFVPVPKGTLQDGGTKVYQALTYGDRKDGETLKGI